MNSTVSVKGNVVICEVDVKTGAVLSRQEVHNLVLNQGLTELANCIAGNRTTPVKFGKFQVGTDGSITSPSMTALGNKVFESDITAVTVNGTVLDMDYYLASGDANTNDLQEAGILLTSDQWGNSKLFARVTYNVITKTEDNAITFNWQINLSAS